ncbi:MULTISPECIES: ATP-binding protein [unclassified Paraburkholderia]|uniref:ATP-binding protein n=1 Tax=unclassified Paraburkholderia TaxID=2615204 RepID=UPI002AB1872B|nr:MULTISPECIES: ATP-binding protein [unclassified Paraburkholderia]
MIAHSIRRRLSLLVLLCVVVVWAVAVYGSFRYASREVREWQDARLVEYARFIARLDTADIEQFARIPFNAQIELSWPGQHRNAQSDSDRLPRDIHFALSDGQGTVISNLPIVTSSFPPALKDDSPPMTIDVTGTAWRIYQLRDERSGRRIQVMEISNTRSDMASGAAIKIISPLILALPALAVMLQYLIRRSLRPLDMVSSTIRRRDARSLTPLNVASIPKEVEVLVDAINRLLGQLRQSIVRERAFTSDAAHELKTPLAAIKVQAQVALTTSDPALQLLAMQRVVQGVDRSARLAEQLLLLARLDEQDHIAASRVFTEELIDEAIMRHAPHAADRGIMLWAHADAHRAIHADPVLIGILLDNLIDNAIKYGEKQGNIEITTVDQGNFQCLAVLDDGPGVDPDDLAKLTDRFYRGTGVQSPGSGLGLSIVERIARYFHGTLRFGIGLNGRGLGVFVEFQAFEPITHESLPGGDHFARVKASMTS